MQANFSVKGQIESMFNFLVYTLSAVTTQLTYYSMKQAKGNVNERICLYSNKTLFTETGGKQIWPGGYCLLISDNSLFAIICI